jgi:hypothetical protein
MPKVKYLPLIRNDEAYGHKKSWLKKEEIFFGIYNTALW